MSARVIVLAEYRDRKARVEMTYDPLAIWAAWFGFWCGAKTK